MHMKLFLKVKLYSYVLNQVIESVVSQVREDLKNKAVVSIVLGYDFDKYNTLLDASTETLLTVMPNTPMAVREGMCLLEQEHSL